MIRDFKTAEEANTFAETVKVSGIDYYDGTFVVQYKPYLTGEDAQRIKAMEDTESATVAIAQAEMHLEYLEEVKTNSEDGANVESGIRNTQQNLINDKAKLKIALKYA